MNYKNLLKLINHFSFGFNPVQNFKKLITLGQFCPLVYINSIPRMIQQINNNIIKIISPINPVLIYLLCFLILILILERFV